MIPALAKFNIQHAIPIPFLVAGFILASLCLSAGNKPGFMEEYALVRIDMSGLGNNLFTSSNDTSSDDDNQDDNEDEDSDDENKDDDDDSGGVSDLLPFRDRRGLGDDIEEGFDKAKDKAKGKIGEIGNELVDGLTENLGVKDWYSLHILTFCQGAFKNGTNNDTEVDKNGFEVDECSQPSTDGKFNLTEVLGTDSLSAGPIDIPIPSGIQRQLQKLHKVILAVIVFYAMALGSAVFALVTNILAIVWPRTYPYRFAVTNFILSTFAAGSAFLASLTTTIGLTSVSAALGDLGEFIGVRVTKGWQFLAITWSMFGVMVIAAGYWGWTIWRMRRRMMSEAMSEKMEELRVAREKIKSLEKDTSKIRKHDEHMMMGSQFMEKAHSLRQG